MALPTFFIIGAGKAGTSSLHHYLDEHPQVQMSANKEPHFFAGPENGFPYTMGRVSQLGDYERLFDAEIPVRGESSPGYTSYPRRQGVPERIKAMVPDAKFIYLVRDPIERTVSHHQHRVAIEGERRSPEEALQDLGDPYAPCICPSMYAMQLERYLEVVALERILVVDQAKLLSDRRGTLERIFSFLDVDINFDSERFDEKLYSSDERRVYPPGYASFIERMVVPHVQRLPPQLRRKLRSSAERVFLPRLNNLEIGDELRERLRELYAADVHRLRELTGQDFATWSV